jgi:hypothetical protein
VRRSPNGFGAKSIFFDVLKAHFDRPQNARRLFTALLGCACEQWINGEYFLALNSSGRAFAVVPEQEKMDLVLTTAEDRASPVLVLETKLLYSGYTLKKQEEKLETLRWQLSRATKRYPMAQAVGLVVSFWWRKAGEGSINSAARGCFVEVERRRELGLTNAFKQRSPYRVRAQGPVMVGGRWFDVRATFEAVRATS